MALDTGLLTRVVNPIKFGINDHITPYITVQARRTLCHWQSHPKASKDSWWEIILRHVIVVLSFSWNQSYSIVESTDHLFILGTTVTTYSAFQYVLLVLSAHLKGI